MKRISVNNTRIEFLTQNECDFSTSNCLTGIISRKGQGFRFEETIRKGRPPHNPKLFDGRYISMVRRRNGRYQCYIKNFNPQDTDLEQAAYDIYRELSHAFRMID